jgi:hypothetical protein
MTSVRSRVHRILRSMGNFYMLPGDVPTPDDLPFQAGEIAIGAYLNNPPLLAGSIFVTDYSLIVPSPEGAWMRMPYDSIVKPLTPPEKLNVHDLCVLLRNGESACFPVTGGSGRCSDVFEFIRFLDRVLADRSGGRP